jgi:hypothetical protein
MRCVNRLQFAARFAVRDELGYLRDYQLLWRAFMVWLVAEPGRPVSVALGDGQARPVAVACRTVRTTQARPRAGISALRAPLVMPVAAWLQVERLVDRNALLLAIAFVVVDEPEHIDRLSHPVVLVQELKWSIEPEERLHSVL